MAVKLSSTAVDTARETSGGWVDSTAFPGVKYLVRGLQYQAFETARDLAFQRIAKAFKTAPVPRAVSSAALGKAVGEHLLLDWSGFDTTFERSTAIETLTDPAYRTVLDDVLRAAAVVAERDIEFIEDLEKN